jgi:hypothetical protein
LEDFDDSICDLIKLKIIIDPTVFNTEIIDTYLFNCIIQNKSIESISIKNYLKIIVNFIWNYLI